MKRWEGARFESTAAPRNRQTKNIGKVVTGVREQRHRIADDTIAGLDQNEAYIKDNSDREGPTEARWCMDMPGFWP